VQVKPEIPASLATFAMATAGPYPARYDAILEEAFTNHKLVLTAHVLRQLAGGGSNTTAQEAVDRFRVKLHKLLSNRIEFGADIPEAVAGRMSAAMDELWLVCRGEAAVAFSQDRQRLEAAANTAVQRELDAKAEVAALAAKMTEAQEQARMAIVRSEDQERQIQMLQEGCALRDREKADLKSRLDAQQAECSQLAESIDALKAQIKLNTDQHEQEKATLRQEFRIQFSEIRREHGLALDRAIKERDAAQGAVAKERATNAEATIQLARVEQQLAHSMAQLLQANTASQGLLAEANALREENGRLNGKVEELSTQQIAAQARLVEVLDAMKTVNSKPAKGKSR